MENFISPLCILGWASSWLWCQGVWWCQSLGATSLTDFCLCAKAGPLWSSWPSSEGASHVLRWSWGGLTGAGSSPLSSCTGAFLSEVQAPIKASFLRMEGHRSRETSPCPEIAESLLTPLLSLFWLLLGRWVLLHYCHRSVRKARVHETIPVTMLDFHSANKWEQIAPIPQELLKTESGCDMQMKYPSLHSKLWKQGAPHPSEFQAKGLGHSQSKREDVWWGNSQTSETSSFQILTSCHAHILLQAGSEAIY